MSNTLEAPAPVKAENLKVNEAILFVEAAKVESPEGDRFEFITEEGDIYFTPNVDLAKQLMAKPNLTWSITYKEEDDGLKLVSARPSTLKALAPKRNQDFAVVVGIRRTPKEVNEGGFAGLWEVSLLDPKDHTILEVLTDANTRSHCLLLASRALARADRAGK